MLKLDQYQPDLPTEDLETLRTAPKTLDYASLHQHTDFSMLDGFSSVDMQFQRAAKIGMKACAVTDHGNVAGHLKAEQAGEKYGVKPILGIEAYLVPRPLAELKAEKSENKTKGRIKNSHGCLWARTQEGLRNLWTLATLSTMPENTYYGKPLISHDLLRQYHEGLILSDGCLLSDTSRFILEDDMMSAKMRAVELLDIMDGWFISELHTFQLLDPKTDADKDLNLQMRIANEGKIKIAKELGIKTIVALDNHYAFRNQHDCHSMVWDMNTGNYGDQMKTERGESAAWLMEDPTLYLEANGVSREIAEESKANSLWLVDSCEDVKIPKGVKYPTLTDNLDSDLELFNTVVENGFQKKVVDRFSDNPEKIQEYRDRLEKEKKVIVSNSFHGYFLVVADYVNYAKCADPEGKRGPFKNKQPWVCGGSRGSSGGCLVAYLLSINETDPIKYDLIFERFLNEGRLSTGEFPDIDIDFPQSRLGEMKTYLKWRYGDDAVCGVSTYSRAKPKSLMKRVAKALGVSFAEANEISKVIDQVSDLDQPVNEETGEVDEDVPWHKILAQKGGDLAEVANKYPEMFTYLEDMMGMIMTQGVHASGMIIANNSLIGALPLRAVLSSDKKSFEWVSQFENSDKFGEDVHELGYIKFDFLGLRHLDTLMEAQKLVRGRVVPGEFYMWSDDRYDDAEVWDQVCSGDTVGLFQEETAAGTELIKRMKPRNERDMSAINALVRPGPMDSGMTEHYINRRDGVEGADSYHPLLKDVLSETYGQMIYQENILRTVQAVAGYSLVDADRVRKAVGKKNMDAITAEREVFVRGCLNNPDFVSHCVNPESLANRIWSDIETAGRYSFNKCLSGDTTITTNKGETFTIAKLADAFANGDELCDDLFVSAYSFTTGKLAPKKVKTVHINGMRKLFRIVTKTGKQIRATAGHRFLNESRKWSRVFELSVTDKVFVYHRPDISDVEWWTKPHGLIVDEIVSILPDETEMTYDLEMYDEDHNFVANGFVSHNSHSQAYSLLTSWEAWYKFYHRTEFTVALLATDADSEAVKYIRDARAHGVDVLPPDVNVSGRKFTMQDSHTIRFGLESIKGIGAAAVDDIFKHRPFESVEDFLSKCAKASNKGIVTRLIKIGAFDSIGERNDTWDRFWEFRRLDKRRDSDADKLAPNWDDDTEMGNIEQELVGTYIAHDPFAPFIDFVEKNCLPDENALDQLPVKGVGYVGGTVTRVKKIITKNGDPMCFMDVEWGSSTFNVTVFPQMWKEAGHLLVEGAPVMCKVQRLERGACLLRLQRLDRFGDLNA